MNRYTERPKVALRKEDLICLLMCFVYLSLHTFLKITPQNFDRTNCSGWNLPWILSALDWFFWRPDREYLTGCENDARENRLFCLQWKYHVTIVLIKLQYLHPLNQRLQVRKIFPCYLCISAEIWQSDRGSAAEGVKACRCAEELPAGSGLSRTFPELFFLRCCRAPARGIIGEAQPWICFLLALNQWGGGGEVRLSRTQKGEAAEGRAEQLLTELRIFFSCLLQVSELTDL